MACPKYKDAKKGKAARKRPVRSQISPEQKRRCFATTKIDRAYAALPPLATNLTAYIRDHIDSF